MKQWFETKFLPAMSRLGNQRHLATIRDAFATTTPILIMGSLAVLWRNVLFTTWNTNEATLPGLWLAFNQFQATAGGAYSIYLNMMNHWMIWINVGVIQFLAMYVAFGIGFFLAQAKGYKTPIIAGYVSLASFMAVTNMNLTVGWETGFYWLGARGLVSAILVGFVSIEMFMALSKSKTLDIQMPAGVPPAVGRAFSALLPVLITMGVMGFANMALWWFVAAIEWNMSVGSSVEYSLKNGIDVGADGMKALIDSGFATAADFNGTVIAVVAEEGAFAGIAFTDPSVDNLGQLFASIDPETFETAAKGVPIDTVGGVTITSFIFGLVVAPFLNLATASSSFMIGLALLYVILVSFFWFFGLHGTNIANGVFLPIWTLLWAENLAGTAEHAFAGPTFDAFIFIGGWGATLPLLISTLIFGKKDSPQYVVAKFGVGPGLFQINEPVTFGFPLVVNGLLAIPLFLIMPVLVFTTWAGIGMFNLVPKYSIPWTTPVGFGGLIATGSGWGFVLALINFTIAAALWTPFVFLMNKQNSADLQAKAANTEQGQAIAAKKEAQGLASAGPRETVETVEETVIQEEVKVEVA